MMKYANPDLADQVIDLTRRTRALETGAFRPDTHLGGYGLNTRWHEAALNSSMKSVPTMKLYWRVRADRVHFKTVGGTVIVPVGWSTADPIARLGVLACPAKLTYISAAGAVAGLSVSPSGRMYWVGGSRGPFHLSGGLYAVG